MQILHYRGIIQMRTSISSLFRTLDCKQSTSLAQIEHQLLTKQKLSREGNKRLLPRAQNISDLQVTSPFYAKPQCSNKNCFCPYHRKLRIKQIANKKELNRNTYAQTTNNSPQKNLKTQAQDQAKLHTSRSPPQRRHNCKMVKTGKWEGRAKVQSHNYQFDQFIRGFQQILLKKTKLTPKDLHKIKSSVGQIFKYIYTHLDETNQVVQEHISKIEKDRDFTNFYMQRFIELKARGSKKKQTNQPRTNKHKTAILAGEEQSRSRNQSKAKTKLYQRRQFSRKTAKGKKLMIEQMLEDINCGEEIEDQEIQKFAALQLQRFDQNCEFLTNKIKHMDEDTLDQLLHQIVIRTKAHEKLSEANQANSSKIATLNTIISLIKAKIKQLQQSEVEERPSSFRTNMSSRSINRGSSNEMRKNQRLTIMGKTNDSLFAKSGFNQLRKEGKDAEIYYENQAEVQEEEGDRHSSEASRQGPKALTICMQGEAEGMRTGKSGKIKLAKYRRLSHDVFIYKRILNEEQQELLSRMKITTLTDIEEQLDNLAFQFAEKKKRIKEIEGKIKDFNLKKFMINDKDSLITAKRKIRVLKSLIKNQQFDPVVKVEMVEYLKLMEEQNYVKNRKWANKKIKNLMQVRPQDQQVQLFDQVYSQGDRFYFQQLVDQLFGKVSKLLYYELLQTSYEEKQINFEHHVMDFMKSTLTLQKKYREVRQGKKTLATKQKVVVREPDEKESALMQVGLNNRCLSNYFVIEGEGGGQVREEESYQPTEYRYLDLLNKLSQFGK